MTATDIKIALLRAEVTQSAIARECGVTPQAVNDVIRGVRSTFRLRAAVAKAIGRSVSEVWDSDHQADNAALTETSSSKQAAA